MKCIKGELYNIIPYEYSEIDEKFIAKTYELFKHQPFKWYDIFETIINNPAFTYVRDSTMIISLYHIDNNKINSLFELLKIYLRMGVIIKIIYKKEFIIVHFATTMIGEIISMRYCWMIIDYYYLLKETMMEGKVYFQAKMENQTEQEKVDLVIEYQNKVLIINAYKNIKMKPCHNHYFYTLQLYKKRGYASNEWTHCLQYFFSKEMQLKTLYSEFF